jgi:hypothetical protein
MLFVPTFSLVSSDLICLAKLLKSTYKKEKCLFETGATIYIRVLSSDRIKVWI